eukprot:g22654.t1
MDLEMILPGSLRFTVSSLRQLMLKKSSGRMLMKIMLQCHRLGDQMQIGQTCQPSTGIGLSSAPERHLGMRISGIRRRLRIAAKKEFNAEVRQLVKFVQKRDPRVLARQKQQMKDPQHHNLPRVRGHLFHLLVWRGSEHQENIEKNQRDRAQKEKQKADQDSEREERKVAARQAEEERWAETKARKETFKSEKAFDQHAKSKKHLQVVAKFRKELDEEMEEEAKNEDRSEESEDSLGHAEQFKPDDFLLRFAAQKSKSAGRGYPAASPPATEEDRGGDGTDGEDGEDADAREEEPVNDVRSRRAQKRQQQTAAASQRRQERENVQDLVNGVKKAQRASKQEAKATDLTGPIPEGNSCGVCKEDTFVVGRAIADGLEHFDHRTSPAGRLFSNTSRPVVTHC